MSPAKGRRTCHLSGDLSPRPGALKLRRMPEASPIAESSRSSLHRMLSPRSIAIVGASTDPVRIGGRPLARLISEGFPGPIYPVNPARETVQGLPAVKSVLDLPEGVDCAIVVVAAEQAVQ